MKILWFTDFFPESDKAEITGGVEARCFFVRRHLEAAGHQVQIIARPTHGQVWKPASFGSMPERFLFTIKSIICGLQSDFDIVEGTNFATYPVAWLVGVLKHKPVVLWYPDVFLGSWIKTVGPVGTIGGLIEWLVLRLPVNHYLAISQSTKDKLVKAGVLAKKISVVDCGVEPAEFVGLKKTVKKFDVCVVSRLVGYKRVDALVAAAPPDLIVAIVGQGPERSKLEKLAVGKKIIFFGHVASHKKVLETIASSRIFCLLSTTEGFGIVIIEAAALGVPFVARDIPVIAEITANGRGGLLFHDDDLSNQINRLLTDKKLYQQKCREATTLAKKYTWEKAAAETEKIYARILENVH
ncbi:MAG: glycosyltransferase family 4 protein [Patescibacteria group bacterium]|nr:glycosyltransferase family 4 protein [Patescibacteria group bacterium]MCL5431573.1 glycosyltransferase family 4 protein [Patescibacteria group bacterium]